MGVFIGVYNLRWRGSFGVEPSTLQLLGTFDIRFDFEHIRDNLDQFISFLLGCDGLDNFLHLGFQGGQGHLLGECHYFL